MIRFAVAGTGRSGTGYASRLLTLAGARCGHEEIFDHDRRASIARALATEPGLAGDSSIAAGAYLDDLRLCNIPVLHLVRRPLDVVNSLVGSRFLALNCPCHPDDPDAHLRTPYAEFMRDEIPEIDDADDEIGRAIRWVSKYSRLIAIRARGPYRLERLEELDAGRLERIVLWLGFTPRPSAELERLIAGLGVEVNRHHRASITWEELADHPDVDLLEYVTHWTGYSLP